jgi:hypothetical protein
MRIKFYSLTAVILLAGVGILALRINLAKRGPILTSEENATSASAAQARSELAGLPAAQVGMLDAASVPGQAAQRDSNIKSVEVNLRSLGRTVKILPFSVGSTVIRPETVNMLRLDALEKQSWEQVYKEHKESLVSEMDQAAKVSDADSGIRIIYQIPLERVEQFEADLAASLREKLDADSRAIFDQVDLTGISINMGLYNPENILVDVMSNGRSLEVTLVSSGKYGRAVRETKGSGGFLLKEFYGKRVLAELKKRGLLPVSKGGSKR